MAYDGVWSAVHQSRAANNAETAANLNNMTGAVGLLKAINDQAMLADARRREAAFRAELAGTPNMSEEQAAQIAMRHGVVDPKTFLQTMENATLKKAQIAATREQAIARITMQADNLARLEREGTAKIAMIADENQRKRAADDFKRVIGMRKLAIEQEAANYKYGVPAESLPDMAQVGVGAPAPAAAARPLAVPPGYEAREKFVIDGKEVTNPDEIAILKTMQNAPPGTSISGPSSLNGPAPISLAKIASDTAPVVAPPSDVNSREMARAASMAPASASLHTASAGQPNVSQTPAKPVLSGPDAIMANRDREVAAIMANKSIPMGERVIEARSVREAAFKALNNPMVDIAREKLANQRGNQTQQQVAKLGVELERAGLPEMNSVIGQVESAMKKTPDLPDYITGPKSLLPDVMIPEEIRNGRQAFHRLFNTTLKIRSGAAVTANELERLKMEYGSGIWKSPEQIQNAINQARDILGRHYASIAAGHGIDAMNAYNENLKSLGGTIILRTNAAKGNSELPAGYKPL